MPACDTFGVEMEISATYVSPGDNFYVYAHICNPEIDQIDQAPFVGMMDIGIGEYWFYPTWVKWPSDFAFEPVDLPNGVTTIQVLPNFTWPDTGTGTFDGITMYGTLLTPAMDALWGDMDFVTFGYGP